MRAIRCLVPLLVVVTSACGRGRPATDLSPRPSTTGSRVLTREMILQWNVIDAYDAIERSGGYRLAENNRGDVAVRQSRGQTSLRNANSDRPALVVDGAMLLDFTMLRQIRAVQIDRIEFLSPADATQRFGTMASGAGAILVTTRGRP